LRLLLPLLVQTGSLSNLSSLGQHLVLAVRLLPLLLQQQQVVWPLRARPWSPAPQDK
jgi:hypothetical protein